MRVIAVPRDENGVLSDERERLRPWASRNVWEYVEYLDAVDLLSHLSDIHSASPVEVIEIVAHGNPATCNDISLGNATVFAASLRRVPGVGAATSVYFSGCNTGLELGDECLARRFAYTFDAPVFGARGYLRGTHAEGTEQCVASFEEDGIVYHAYPGGTDGTGPHVWKRFGPLSRSIDGAPMQIKIATSGFRPVSLGGDQTRDLVSAVEALVQTSPAQSARLRMAPDLTFSVLLVDGEHVFELLAGGTVLRDPVTKRVWQFDGGREILLRLLPYRNLPAA